MKDGEVMDEKPEDEPEQGTPLPSNLVEVETPSETWKTEFKNEISSFGLMVRMYPKFIGLWKSFVICAIPATEPFAG